MGEYISGNLSVAQAADNTDVVFRFVLPFHAVWMEGIQTVPTDYYVSLHPDHVLLVIVDRHVADADDLYFPHFWLVGLPFPPGEGELNQVHLSHHG